jgi:XRE family transcriptional regulator, regulator of sulfur utilization
MGVEGKDKAKVLEAGAASLSNQLGQAVLKLRKGYGLSLADLSQHSGVAKSIISQIERNETNPTLTTIWRLAHALDVSIESMLRGTAACGGETLRYRCDMPHRIRNLSEKPAHATMVCILKAAMMD